MLIVQVIFLESSDDSAEHPQFTVVCGMVQRVHYEALESYHSYDAAWLGPILFPLSFAIAAQLFVYADCLRQQRGTAKKSWVVDSAVFCIMLAETVFAVLCITSCIINRVNRAYVGGAGACDYQAFYASAHALLMPPPRSPPFRLLSQRLG